MVRQSPQSASTGKSTKTSESKTKASKQPARRESIRVTRTQIKKPQTDEEFVAEYSKYPVAEQNRRITLIGNITRTEAERRLSLLGRKHEELERVLNIFDQDQFTKLRALGDTENRDYYQYYEEVPEPENPVIPEFEEIYPTFDDFDEQETPDMASTSRDPPPRDPSVRQHSPDDEDVDDDIPAWARNILQQQQRLLTKLVENRHQDVRPIKADDIYQFKPDDSKTGIDYFLFAERIADMVNVHGEEKILPSLISCLKNDLAKEWYSLLSDEDKEALRTSADSWIEALKRDFGIKPSIARQKANRENFYFSQGRRVLDYYHKKVTWLKISGVNEEESVCMEVRDGLRDPEFRALIRIGDKMTLAKLRSDITEVENDARALWLKNQGNSFGYNSPGLYRGLGQSPETAIQRGRGGGPSSQFARGGGRSYYQNSNQNPSTFANRNSMPQRNNTRSFASQPFPRQARNSQPTNRSDAVALTANDSATPPRPCRFCGQLHWDRDCPRYNPQVVHHFADYDDEYERAQEEYLYNFAASSGTDFYEDLVDSYVENQDEDCYYSESHDDSISQYHFQPPQSVSPTTGPGKSVSRLSFAPTPRTSATPASSASTASRPASSMRNPTVRHPKLPHSPLSPSVRLTSPVRPTSANAMSPMTSVSPTTPTSASHPNSQISPNKTVQPSPHKAEPSTTPVHGSSEDVGGPIFTHNYNFSSDASRTNVCEVCKKEFPSRNLLFQHLNIEKHKLKKDSRPQVIPSTAPSGKVGTGLNYRDYTYAEIQYQTSIETVPAWGCLDTGGPMSCIDAEVLNILPWQDRKFTPPVEIEIRGVAGRTTSTESVVLNVYFPDISDSKYGLIKAEFHVVDKLDCGILFGQDIIEPNGFVIDSQRGRAWIRACQNLECQLRVKRVKTVEDLAVRSATKFVIPGRSTAAVPLRMPSATKSDIDYIIHPYVHNRWLPIGCYLMSGIINGSQSKVFVTNISDFPATISKGTRVGKVSSLSCSPENTSHWEDASKEVSIHLTYSDHSEIYPHHTTTPTSPLTTLQSSDVGPLDDDFLFAGDVYSFQVGTLSPDSSITSSVVDKVSSFFTKPNPNKKMQSPPKYRSDIVTINPQLPDDEQNKLRAVLRKHEPVFSEKLGLAKEPPEDHLRIPLYPGAERQIKPLKPYRLSPEEKKCVDEMFDELRSQGRIVDAKGSPCGWQVFVVKKGRKWRPVVDLRPLNALVVPDAYPIPRQEDIITCVRGRTRISLFDQSSAYYQRTTHEDDQWKLCIATHRGHEMFTVPPMGLSVSVAHQQKFMDKLLKDFKWKVAMVYLDDIVVFSFTFDEHLKDIDDVLTVLENAGLTLSPQKCLVGFSSIKLLGKIVDSFGLSTTEERAAAITNQKWPENLRQLDTFLGQCGYVRDHIPYYSKITAPLHHLKTRLFKGGPSTKPARKRWAQNIMLDPPTATQKRAFELVKEAVGAGALMHLNYEKPFIMYIDGSKEMGYGVAVFQFVDDRKEVPKEINHTDIKPVMYLSRELKSAELHYWPTELEAGGLVWAVQKLRHIVQSSYCVVYTDYRASEAIAKMRGLQTVSPGKKNLRLANWSLFLSQYWANLDVRYCKGIENVMADGLSRLRTEILELTEEDILVSELRERREKADEDDVFVFNMDETEIVDDGVVSASLVEMSDEFKTDLVNGYKKDAHFKSIVDVLNKHHDQLHDRTTTSPGTSSEQIPISDWVSRPRSPYKLQLSSKLLYYEDLIDGKLRLCVPSGPCLKKVLGLAHNKENHYGVAKTYSRLISSFFAPSLLQHVKKYIAFCPKCLINNTLRDKTHGELQPITTAADPFHTLCMDFILSLPPAAKFGHGEELFDCVMPVTDKFTKAVRLLIGKTTYSATDWATMFWDEIYPDWGFPRQIVSDRDPKFLSEFWKSLFEKAGAELLMSTAYHPQTDGQSEHTNQSIEIALRHYVSYNQTDWPDHLSTIQAAINTSVAKATKHSPLETLYGFTPRHVLDLFKATPSVSDDWAQIRDAIRRDAADSIVHAQQEMIKFTDPKRKPLTFTVGDKAYLRLSNDRSKGYTLPSIIKPKISQQRVGPFEITQVVGKNAYRLKLPVTWRIHDVISVVYLDPAPKDPDPFDREPPPPPPVVKTADDPEAEWEVECILKKRVTKKGRRGKPCVEYLVRWKGFGPEYDEWQNIDRLYTCPDLVQQFEHSQGNSEWSPPQSWAISEAENDNIGEFQFHTEDDVYAGEIQFHTEPAAVITPTVTSPLITTTPSSTANLNLSSPVLNRQFEPQSTDGSVDQYQPIPASILNQYQPLPTTVVSSRLSNAPLRLPDSPPPHDLSRNPDRTRTVPGTTGTATKETGKDTERNHVAPKHAGRYIRRIIPSSTGIGSTARVVGEFQTIENPSHRGLHRS